MLSHKITKYAKKYPNAEKSNNLSLFKARTLLLFNYRVDFEWLPYKALMIDIKI